MKDKHSRQWNNQERLRISGRRKRRTLEERNQDNARRKERYRKRKAQRTDEEEKEHKTYERERKRSRRRRNYDYSTDRHHPYYTGTFDVKSRAPGTTRVEKHIWELRCIRREVEAAAYDENGSVRPHYGSVEEGIPLLLLLLDGVLLMQRDTERPTLDRPVLKVLRFQGLVYYHGAGGRPNNPRG